jgi:hypothetical protein
MRSLSRIVLHVVNSAVVASINVVAADPTWLSLHDLEQMKTNGVGKKPLSSFEIVFAQKEAAGLD